MKKTILIFIFLSSFLFAKWENWEEVQLINQNNQPVAGSSAIAIYNTDEKNFNSLVFYKNKSLVLALPDDFKVDLYKDKSGKIICEIDSNPPIEITGSVSDSYSWIPVKSKNYFYAAAMPGKNKNDFKTLIDLMKTGKKLKITVEVPQTNFSLEIPLDNFKEITKAIEVRNAKK